MGSYLIRKWIAPNFIFPEHNEILTDFTPGIETFDNFLEITKVLQQIFNQSFFPPEDIKYGLNDYIAKVIPHVSAYYKELINVNDEIVDQLAPGQWKIRDKIKSRSICISVSEIQAIVDGIIKMKPEMSQHFPEAVTLAENLSFLDKEQKLFGDKLNPSTKKPLKPHQAYVLFYELIFPEDLNYGYLEEFLKMQGFSKTLSEDKKVNFFLLFISC